MAADDGKFDARSTWVCFTELLNEICLHNTHGHALDIDARSTSVDVHG